MKASPSKQIKAKLKKEFPGVKFSVTSPSTRTHHCTSVHIAWDMEIGSNLTCDVVNAVTDEFNTHEIINNSGVTLFPVFSKERKDWTSEAIKNIFVDSETKLERMRRYNDYIRNGVCSNIDFV